MRGRRSATRRAVFDEQLQQWISDAEVAEIPFTAFASRGKKHAVTARLIVRRVRDANPDHVSVNAQGELFRVWRHHAVFTDSPLPMLARRGRPPPARDHRTGHRRPEERPARAPALGQLRRQLRLAGARHDRVQPAPAPPARSPRRFHARATTATLRAQLINVAARVARSARRTRLRLPTNWPWAGAWQRLFTAATGPPTPA